MYPLMLCRCLLLGAGLGAGLGVAGVALAQSAARSAGPPAPAATPPATVAEAGSPGPLRPGDRNCLRSTGSLIPAAPGHCLSVPGRSYSQQDLRRTGQIDTSRALQQLDPSISLGH